MDYKYYIIDSQFGNLGLVWTEASDILVKRVFLPDSNNAIDKVIKKVYPNALMGKGKAINGLIENVQSFLTGEDIKFDLTMVDMNVCQSYQKQVLKAEHMIPRTWISTYGRIAWALGTPNNSRAVGNALAKNPFPIIIPCHRAVRSDGSLGGFQGGLAMKKKLLEMEGIEFSSSDKVLMTRVYY